LLNGRKFVPVGCMGRRHLIAAHAPARLDAGAGQPHRAIAVFPVEGIDRHARLGEDIVCRTEQVVLDPACRRQVQEDNPAFL
jgi:hypothetical protein